MQFWYWTLSKIIYKVSEWRMWPVFSNENRQLCVYKYQDMWHEIIIYNKHISIKLILYIYHEENITFKMIKIAATSVAVKFLRVTSQNKIFEKKSLVKIF